MFFAKCVVVLCAAAAASASSYPIGNTDVIFHLFTRSNPTTSEPLLSTVSSIMTSSFSLTRRTIFTIHSFGETVGGNFNAFVVPAELTADDVNVIAVDWSTGSSLYTVGLANAPAAGRIIASFIDILSNNFGYNTDMVRIVGHGLGGHVAGIAARNAGGTIPHVIALDPSFHGWSHHTEMLAPDAATLVEVLHTTGGIVGYDYPLGHLDFYANGGSAQNGCASDVSCSHIYAYAFYAESLTAEVTNGPRFVGTSCDSYEDAVELRCAGARDVVFGGVSPKSSSNSGIYMFLTNFFQPFARD